MSTFWILHRRAVIAIAATVALLLAAIAAAAVFHSSGRTDAGHRKAPDVMSTMPKRMAPAPQARASDAAEWDAKAPVRAAVSRTFPAITGAATADPTSFAKAFVSQLFTRDYAVAERDELLAWAQFEDAPLQSAQYPRADWTKVLVDSLTDLTWDDATSTPVPAPGPWLALRAQRARDQVADIDVTVDPQWEQKISDGYTPPDRLATIRDVTFTVIETVASSGHVQAHRFSGALDLQLGTSNRGTYGVAATNNFVLREVG